MCVFICFFTELKLCHTESLTWMWIRLCSLYPVLVIQFPLTMPLSEWGNVKIFFDRPWHMEEKFVFFLCSCRLFVCFGIFCLFDIWDYLVFCFCFVLRKDHILKSRLGCNPLSNLGWPKTYSYPSSSASWILGCICIRQQSYNWNGSMYHHILLYFVLKKCVSCSHIGNSL